MGNTGMIKDVESTGKRKRNNIVETAGIAGIAGVTSHNVTARTLEAEVEETHTVEVLGQGTLEDGQGNVMLATAIIDEKGRESILADSDNDGYADFIVSDINQDGEISTDEISNLNGLDVDMNNPDAEIIHQSIEAMTYDHSLPDYINDAEMHQADLG